MISKLKSGKGMVGSFGNGTIRITYRFLKTKGQLLLTSGCKREVGTRDPDLGKASDRLLLNFETPESLDVLIGELTELRKLFESTNNSEAEL